MPVKYDSMKAHLSRAQIWYIKEKFSTCKVKGKGNKSLFSGPKGSPHLLHNYLKLGIFVADLEVQPHSAQELILS